MKDPSQHVRDLASKVIDIARDQTSSWTEAGEVMELALGFMFVAIKDEKERAFRMALLANAAIYRADQLRDAAEGAGLDVDPPPVTRQ